MARAPEQGDPQAVIRISDVSAVWFRGRTAVVRLRGGDANRIELMMTSEEKAFDAYDELADALENGKPEVVAI